MLLQKHLTLDGHHSMTTNLRILTVMFPDHRSDQFGIQLVDALFYSHTAVDASQYSRCVVRSGTSLLMFVVSAFLM